jgi:beta-phosphoglucomutase family hydrolase
MFLAFRFLLIFACMKAFIFDLNGTMINDMAYHLDAWHYMINNDLGATLNREAVKKEMHGKNEELLVRVFGEGHFTPAQMADISIEKEKRYQQVYLPHLQLIAGLPQFLENAYKKGIPMAIGSAAITFNIDFVLDNLHIRHYFKAIVSADNVTHSKPDPETYLKAAALLGVEPASCIVFEDAPKGVEAAANAGMDCVVLTTMHTPEEFAAYNNIIAFVDDYTAPVLTNLAGS